MDSSLNTSAQHLCLHLHALWCEAVAKQISWKCFLVPCFVHFLHNLVKGPAVKCKARGCSKNRKLNIGCKSLAVVSVFLCLVEGNRKDTGRGEDATLTDRHESLFSASSLLTSVNFQNFLKDFETRLRCLNSRSDIHEVFVLTLVPYPSRVDRLTGESPSNPVFIDMWFKSLPVEVLSEVYPSDNFHRHKVNMSDHH